MSVTTACSEQYHGVGPDNLSFDCSITIRPRNHEDLQVPGKAPVSSAFQVAPTGISVSGGLESAGGFIQEVHVKRIPPDRNAPIASIGEGYSLTSYDPQNGTPLFKQLRKLKPNVSPSLPETSPWPSLILIRPLSEHLSLWTALALLQSATAKSMLVMAPAKSLFPLNPPTNEDLASGQMNCPYQRIHFEATKVGKYISR
jgi:hypothetical protein